LVIEYQGHIWLLEFQRTEDDGGLQALD